MGYGGDCTGETNVPGTQDCANVPGNDANVTVVPNTKCASCRLGCGSSLFRVPMNTIATLTAGIIGNSSSAVSGSLQLRLRHGH